VLGSKFSSGINAVSIVALILSLGMFCHIYYQHDVIYNRVNT